LWARVEAAALHCKCDAKAVEIETIYGGNQEWLLTVWLLAFSRYPPQ
jgi:hypothetical protein